jgi:hypothetical protein
MSQSEFERYAVCDIKELLSEATELLAIIEEFSLSGDSLQFHLKRINMCLCLSKDRIEAVTGKQVNL